MTHKRQTIRDAVVAIIGTVPTLTGRVVSTRTRPTDVKELPCAIVYTLSETSAPFSVSGTLQRTLSVAVELRISASDAIDAALDALCQSVEQAIAADPRLGRRAINTALTSTVIGLDGEGEVKQALATLTYTVIYTTDAGGS